jgi:hypothetical protein
LSNARCAGAAKRGESSARHVNAHKPAKVADRDVGGRIKEKAGTATHDKYGRPIGGSGYDPDTGRTTSSFKNGNGTHDVTVTDKDGKIISTGTSGKEPSGGSTTFGGTHTTSLINGPGNHTVTTTDGKGNTTTTTTGREPIGGSSTHSDGTTTTSVRNGDGSHTVTTTGGDRDVGGRMKERAGTGTDGWRRDDGGRGDRGDRGDGGGIQVGGDVAVIPVLPFGPPNSGSSNFEGTTTTVTGIGTDHKTVTRIDQDGNVKVTATPPAAPFVPSDDLGAALKKLQDAAKRYAEAKAEARSAHISLDSIVGSDNLPADVKANIPDALNRAADADKNLKAATQDLQRAMNDVQQQVAAQAAHG